MQTLTASLVLGVIAKRQIIFGHGRVGGYGIPSLLQTNGTLIVLAEHRVFGVGDNAGQHNLACKRSVDVGRTWTNCSGPYSTGSDVLDIGKWRGTVASGPRGQGLWDPSPVADDVTGTIFIHFSYTRLPNIPSTGLEQEKVPWIGENWVINSTDGGATWGLPVNISDQLQLRWCHRGVSGSSGVQIKSTGRLLLSGYHIDCEGIDPQTPNKTDPFYHHDPEVSHMIYSDDHGKTWRSSGPQLQGAVEGTIVPVFAETDQHLLASFRYDGYRFKGMHCSLGVLNCKRLADSFDGGITWSNVRDEGQIPDSNCKSGLTRWEKGHGLVHASAIGIPAGRSLGEQPASRANTSVFISLDNGKTWPHVAWLCDGYGHDCLSSGYTSVAMADADTIAVATEADESRDIALFLINAQAVVDGNLRQLEGSTAVASSSIASTLALTWECDDDMWFSNPMGLRDDDWTAIRTVEACRKECEALSGDCRMIYFHKTDAHCHTLTGAVGYDDFRRFLSASDEYETCMRYEHEPPPPPPPHAPLPPVSPGLPPVGRGCLTFLAIGDWGVAGGTMANDTYWPGAIVTAAESQYAAARGMESIAQRIDPAFTILLGDNFYRWGINGGGSKEGPGQGSVRSARFQNAFEEVYHGPMLDRIPFYAIAGNHDHNGNVSAQIEYTHFSPSQRWRYPDFYHGERFRVPDTNTTLEILLFDSVIGLGSTDDNEREWMQPPGPVDPPSAERQWRWLESRLASSTADYVFVGDHYPVYSICEHGPTGALVDRLRPMLERYGAHHFAGHDHCLGHISANGVEYVTTGAGYMCCYEPTNVDQVPENSVRFFTASRGGSGFMKLPMAVHSGFTSYYVYPDRMQVVFHAHDGTVLYKTPHIKPRKRPVR